MNSVALCVAAILSSVNNPALQSYERLLELIEEPRVLESMLEERRFFDLGIVSDSGQLVIQDGLREIRKVIPDTEGLDQIIRVRLSKINQERTQQGAVQK